jgi:hypothetical protein
MTLKQKQVAKKLLENPSLPVGKAMLEAGYSPNTAIAPAKNLTGRKSWNELMEKYLPDEEALTATKEALKANKIITSHTEPDFEYPDHAIRLKAADQVYNLKGHYVEKGTTVQILNTGDTQIEFIGNDKSNIA